MAAKKDKDGIESLRTEILALRDSFSRFRDAMLTDAAVQQAEKQQSIAAIQALNLPAITETDVADAANTMAALAHPLRLRIAITLTENPVSVGELVETLNLSTTGAAYHHLKAMMNQGLVEQPKRGTFSLTEEALPRVQRLLTGLFGTAPVAESGKSGKKKNK